MGRLHPLFPRLTDAWSQLSESGKEHLVDFVEALVRHYQPSGAAPLRGPAGVQDQHCSRCIPRGGK